MNDRLEFTFGPVQEFVAEARRTRDLWAGSFLLAYLSGAAINSIIPEAKIVFPHITKDPIIKALSGGVAGDKPLVGTLPNRFSVEGEQLPALANKAKAALEEAWERIENSVWIFIENQAGHLITKYLKNTWKRQVQSQWSINWVVSNKPSTLGMRKNLRNFDKNEEPGEKCTVCGKRSVLTPESGLSRRKVIEFWSEFVKTINNLRGQQFRSKGRERLCAICTIKRLYPLVSDESLGKGSSVDTSYPSTNFLAAIPFLSELIKKAREEGEVREALKSFVAIAKKAEVPLSEDGMKMPLLRRLVNGITFLEEVVRLDGEVWYESVLSSEMKNPASSMKDPHSVLEQLTELYKKANLGKPSPFYCLLIMDGDRMGELLTEFRDKEHEISASLAEFTDSVTKMQEAEGFAGSVVYSGGDDVLALLPVDQGLKLAHKLRNFYVEAFKKKGNDRAAISAALVFAHFNMPLQTVVSDAHRLLDDVAKDSMGRNAFAVRIWKRSGPVLTFAKNWDDGKDWVAEIYHLVDEINQGFYSSRFLYKLPQIMDFVQRGDVGNAFSKDAIVKLLTAEYMRERNPEKKYSPREAEERVRRLVDLATWKQGLKGIMEDLSGRGTLDGPMFVRFLSSKGGD